MRAAPCDLGIDFGDEDEDEDDGEVTDPPIRWAIEPIILNASGEISITEPDCFSNSLYR